MKRKSQILGGGKETKNWVILCARSMTPGLIWSPALCVLLHAIRQIRGLGLAMLMVPAMLLTVSHTLTQTSLAQYQQTASTFQSGAITRHARTICIPYFVSTCLM
jgi:hypothetical protein